MLRRYYTLSDGYDGCARPGDWILSLPIWINDSVFNLKESKIVGLDWNPNVYAFSRHESGDCDTLQKPDFPIVLGEWQAVSSRIRGILESKWPSAFEFLPIRTRTSTGQDITTTYSILHYLDWVDAVDRKHSTLLPNETKLSRSDGQDFLLENVVLARRKLTSPICRVLGWSPYFLYREDVVETLTEFGFSGAVFTEVEAV